MDPDAIALFHELADRSASEREEYYARHRVPESLRVEVESLLRFDRDTVGTVEGRVAAAAAQALADADADRDARREAGMLGRVIGQYRIVEKIGEGGMGVVYRAEDLTLHRSVAAKIINDRFNESADARARFLREARSVAALNHPNICTIHEVLEVDGGQGLATPTLDSPRRPLIILELVEGETVQHLLSRTGRLAIRDLLSIASQAADALAEAHTHRIIHRDLKPGNIMVTPAGRVKMLDFGLAKPMAVPAEAADETTGAVPAAWPLAQTSSLAGTIAYMSPEQAEGRPLDCRSDVFSFGTVLYEMACGRRPFEAETQAGTIARILQADPPSILECRDELPVELERIVRRCLQKNPSDRYGDTRELLDDLRELYRSVSTPSAVVPAAAPLSRRQLVLLVVAGAAVALLLTRTLLPRAPVSIPAPTHRQVTFVGDASYPVVSPEGTMVAYVRGDPWGEISSMVTPRTKQRLVITDVTGNGQALEIGECVRCRDLEWAPDGSGVLVADEGAGVVLFSRLGGERRRYPLTTVHLAWSPDGQKFATAALSSTAISIVDKETGERTSLPLKPSRIQLRALQWSPAGQWIAVLTHDERSRSSILLVSRDGNTQHQILTEESQISAINWSRADAIYFLRQRAQIRELWKIRVAAETGRAVQPAVLVLGGLQAGPNFAVSRDGGKILYTREIRYSNLWVASLGKTPQTGASASRQLTSGTLADNFPAVSPDGTQIAFVRNDGQASNVFVMPFTGGPARQLTFLNSASGAAAWSPDGTALAFCAADNGVMKLWTLPVAGGAPRPYDATRCTSSTSEVPVAWVRPNTVLYQRTGNRNYHLLDLPSASEAPLVQNEAVGWVFAPRLSPDAAQLAVFWNRAPRRGLFVLPWPARDAMARYLADAAWPIGWSADRRSIYAYDMKASTVLEIRLDGSAPVVLKDLSDRRIALLPAITPDKNHIVFSAHAIHSDVWIAEGFDPEIIQP